MAGLQKINKQAIGYVERKSKMKFYKKPTIRYSKGDCNNTLRTKAGHITEARVTIDKDLSKYPFNLIIPPVVIHELRENLGFQHGENKHIAHRNARIMEQRFVRTKAKSKSGESTYYCLVNLAGYSSNKR